MVLVLTLTSVVGLTIAALLKQQQQRTWEERRFQDRSDAYYHAENALVWVANEVAKQAKITPQLYSWKQGNLRLQYLQSLPPGSMLSSVTAEVRAVPGSEDQLEILSTAEVGGQRRTLRAVFEKQAPARVFDYPYFINNWGWFNTRFTLVGDMRANWHFDFRSRATLLGKAVSGGEIRMNNTAVNPEKGHPSILSGKGAAPKTYLHAGAPRLPMPNLQRFEIYHDLAARSEGTLRAGKFRIKGVHNNETQPGLYLTGTSEDPVEIQGSVIVPGDVVLSGVITGTGTLFVGGNLYIAGDIQYARPADYSKLPAANLADEGNWVTNAWKEKKDLICFAIKESIYGGQVNSYDWKRYCYNAAEHGLKFLGDEADLGEDGIANTADDRIPFEQLDGTFSTANDVDEDGVIDRGYDYEHGIKVTAKRAATIFGYPTDEKGKLVDYMALSTNKFNRIDGVYYSSHAIALRSTKTGLIWNGAIVARDEALVFSRNGYFTYDPRMHSRYQHLAKAETKVALALPAGSRIQLQQFEEVQ
jgi:hypothetical protein